MAWDAVDGLEIVRVSKSQIILPLSAAYARKCPSTEPEKTAPGIPVTADDCAGLQAGLADGYGNHRVAVFDADSGKFKRMWGAFGNKPIDDDNCKTVIPKSFSDPGPSQFSIVHALRVANDGIVYVADLEYRRVQMFSKEGKFLKQLVRTNETFAYGLALSPDPDQQFLYVGGEKGVYVVDRKTLEIVGKVQAADLTGLSHEIATDSKGNLYLAQITAGIRKLTYKGMSLASR